MLKIGFTAVSGKFNIMSILLRRGRKLNQINSSVSTPC
jgi:hypothetical protein